MSLALASALVLAQLGAPVTTADARLQACLRVARNDPATAISDASQWLEGLFGPERSHPLQCLGFAYMSLLRWEAAEDAFSRARDARESGDFANRARLGAMAGNAALAAGDNDAALTLLSAARGDALAAQDDALAGSISAERARAFVALGQLALAEEALGEARQFDPQSAEVWLLSATLARRQEQLDTAQAWIERAAALAPQDPAVGLEAGLIAAMAGFDDAARASWQSVIATASASPQAATARDYLAQLDALEDQ